MKNLLTLGTMMMSNLFGIVEKPAITIIGIECRTSNCPEAGPHDIPRHWEKFYSESIADQIPNKISNEVIALYCDYEGDYTMPYSLVIGCPVSSESTIPKGMTAKTIPAGSYTVFNVVGEYPKALIETWNQIWQQTDLQRTYTGDYEAYTQNGCDVYIAVKSDIAKANQSKFAAIRSLNLPLGQYAITGSGALGIRNLRVIGDIDIIVTPELWKVLEKTYGSTTDNQIKKITFPDGIVEAFGEGSYFPKDENAPSLLDRIAQAEIIDGLPFESLEHVLYFKQMMGREKDKKDIELIVQHNSDHHLPKSGLMTE